MAATARSGRSGIRTPMAAIRLTLRTGDDPMAHVDRLAAPQVDHLPPAETRRADGAQLACVTDDDLVSRPDFARRVDHADREHVPFREEVFDLHPIRVPLRAD